jgi:hypothetical protein
LSIGPIAVSSAASLCAQRCRKAASFSPFQLVYFVSFIVIDRSLKIYEKGRHADKKDARASKTSSIGEYFYRYNIYIKISKSHSNLTTYQQWCACERRARSRCRHCFGSIQSKQGHWKEIVVCIVVGVCIDREYQEKVVIGARHQKKNNRTCICLMIKFFFSFCVMKLFLEMIDFIFSLNNFEPTDEFKKNRWRQRRRQTQETILCRCYDRCWCRYKERYDNNNSSNIVNCKTIEINTAEQRIIGNANND